MLPEPVLAPLECWLNPSPIQVEKCSPDRMALGSGTPANRAVAEAGPMPGLDRTVGLSIARSIATAHHGRIWADNKCRHRSNLPHRLAGRGWPARILTDSSGLIRKADRVATRGEDDHCHPAWGIARSRSGQRNAQIVSGSTPLPCWHLPSDYAGLVPQAQMDLGPTHPLEDCAPEIALEMASTRTLPSIGLRRYALAPAAKQRACMPGSSRPVTMTTGSAMPSLLNCC